MLKKPMTSYVAKLLEKKNNYSKFYENKLGNSPAHMSLSCGWQNQDNNHHKPRVVQYMADWNATPSFYEYELEALLVSWV